VLLCSQLLLIGADSGLFAMQFVNDVDHRPLTHVAGVDGTIHAVDGHADPGLVFFVIGMCVLFDALPSITQQLTGLRP